MSFGALSANAIRALNARRQAAATSRTTPAKARFSRYHRENGGDIIWEIGSGYFGCRNADGRFDAGALRRSRRATPQVKMIEIKLSQGAKPGHGGVLPAAEGVAGDRAHARGVPIGRRLHLAGAPPRVLDAARD